MGQRMTGMTSGQAAAGAVDLQVRAAWIVGRMGQRTAAAHGETGRPALLHQDDAHGAINHDPAITFMLTGFQLPGRPSMGSWIVRSGQRKQRSAGVRGHGLAGSATKGSSALIRLWGSGFLPSRHQGVSFRSAIGLYLANPNGNSAQRAAGSSTHLPG